MISAQKALQIFRLDAISDWKDYYRTLKEIGKFSRRRRVRRFMKQIRREAALERKLAAAQREIERLEDLVIAYECGAEKQAQDIEDARAWSRAWKANCKVNHGMSLDAFCALRSLGRLDLLP